MKVLLAVFLCLCVLGLTHGRSTGPLRVANGTAEEPHSSPWQAKLFFIAEVGIHLWPCGGTLISKNYVLTAARCLTYGHVTKSYSDIIVALGIWDIRDANEPGSLYINTNASSVSVHEGYNATTHENDLALIKLPNTIELSSQIQPAKLLSTESVKVGQVSHISGWEYPKIDRNVTHYKLHGGEVTVVENSVCQQEYPSYVINENMLCASGTVAMCYGDEGSALPINGTVAGIAVGSTYFVPPEEHCLIVPNTYLYIPKYLDWIKANSDYTD